MLPRLHFALKRKNLIMPMLIVIGCFLFGPFPTAHAAATLVNVNNNVMDFGLPDPERSTNGLGVGDYYYYDTVFEDADHFKVDAKITIQEIVNGASLGLFDDPQYTTKPETQKRFNPTIATTSGEGYINFKIDFLENGTENPVELQNFYVTLIDIDGDANAQEFIEISGFESYTIDDMSTHADNKKLTIVPKGGGLTRFSGIKSTHTGLDFDDTSAVIVNYTAPVSTLNLVAGNTATLSSRQFSINFGAKIDDFTNEITKLGSPVLEVEDTTVEWRAISNVSKYKVNIYTSSGDQVGSTIDNGLTTDIDLSDLARGTYYVQVQAIGNGTTYQDSDWSAKSSNILISIPVDDLSAGSPTTTTVNLSFSPPKGASSVVVEQSLTGDPGSWSTATTSSGITAASTGAVVTGLTPDTHYFFRLVVTGGEYAGTSNTADETTAEQIVTTIQVSGSDGMTISAAGGPTKTETYTAQVLDQDGAAMTGQTITWSLDGTPVGVTIDPDTGVVSVTTAASESTITVKATSGSVSGTKDVDLTKEPSTVTTINVDGSDGITISAAGGPTKTETYTAEVLNQYGSVMSGQTITWSLDGTPTGVTIDPDTGVVSVTTAASEGTITVKATSSSVSGTKDVDLTEEPSTVTTINVTGDDEIIVSAPGGETSTAIYSAQVLNQHGSPMSGQVITWSLDAPPAGATIDSATGIVSIVAGTQATTIKVRATVGAVSGTKDVTLNAQPVAGNINKPALAGAVVQFNASDFTDKFTDADGDPLTTVTITLDADFLSDMGEMWYTDVTTAVYLLTGANAISAVYLDSLQFKPVSTLPDGSVVSFPWVGNDGKSDSETARVYITYNSLPIASPLSVHTDENAPVAIALEGTDDDPDTVLIYEAENPANGTLTLVGGPLGNQYTYTPNVGFSGTDTFTYTVMEAVYGPSQRSLPATVTITVHKLFEGWVGSAGHRANADAIDVVDAKPGNPLELYAMTSLQAASVTAVVYGSAPPVELTLVNTTAGYLEWGLTYTLPEKIPSGEHTVVFTVKKIDDSLLPSAESNSDNRFRIPTEPVLVLHADPAKILGDGKSTTNLIASITDDNGPVEGVEVVFSAPAGHGMFVGSDHAITGADGTATVVYKSEKITGVDEQLITLTAEVHDVGRGLFAEGSFVVTFMPPTISGVITREGVPVAGASITVTHLDEHGAVDFTAVVVTDENGHYSVPVPEGDQVYNLDVVQKVLIGGTETDISFKQKAIVGEVSGSGDERFDSEETITGIVFFKQGDAEEGKSSLFDTDVVDHLKVYIKKPDGTYIMDGGVPKAFALDDQGVFNADGLTKNVQYTLEIRYEFAPGQDIILKKRFVQVTTDGEMNITEELIDPYGKITDAADGKPIVGATVVLYYADTDRNKTSGRTPGDEVYLPPIFGFEPNNNKSPDQSTDVNGDYAYMVYPETDYYIIVSKEGYYSRRSPVIEVDFDIKKQDMALTRISSGLPGGPGPVLPPVAPPVDPEVTLHLSIDENLVSEEGSSTITVDYKNTATGPIAEAEVTVTLPKGAVVADAGGGAVEGDTITWKLTNLPAGEGGSYKFKVNWQQLTAVEADFKFKVEFKVNGKSTETVIADSQVKIKVFSNRFGELQHLRYIMGYPDGTFQVNNPLTRAELAAIIARLTENAEVDEPLTFRDVAETHWAANYIKIVTKHGYFRGFEDGSFRPETPVTRAELASVMVRFLGIHVGATEEPHFSDVKGHWAAEAIEELYRQRFLSGYPDGTFRPNDRISRVEAVSLINRMLYRGPLRGISSLFPDVAESHWGFGDIMEASFSHESKRNADGSENWLNRLEDNVQ